LFIGIDIVPPLYVPVATGGPKKFSASLTVYVDPALRTDERSTLTDGFFAQL
jgi:hypothetical protein